MEFIDPDKNSRLMQKKTIILLVVEKYRKELIKDFEIGFKAFCFLKE